MLTTREAKEGRPTDPANLGSLVHFIAEEPQQDPDSFLIAQCITSEEHGLLFLYESATRVGCRPFPPPLCTSDKTQRSQS